MLTRALDLHALVEKPRDRDWLLILLDYLKAYVQELGKALLITKDDHIAYTSSLVHTLREAALAIDSGTIIVFLLATSCLIQIIDVTQPDHPAISISVADNDAKLAENRDGALVNVKINNLLPCVCVR